jgi:hypothetical protein
MKTLRRVSTVFGAVIAVALMCATTALAQERPAPAASAVADHHGSSAKPAGDGIKVHGHWTVDVHNADGSLASHNEFENACSQCGEVLVPLLAKVGSIIRWRVFAGTLNHNNAPCSIQNNQSPCELDEVGTPVEPGMEATTFPTLQLSANGAVFQLAGTFTATFTGVIDYVISQADGFAPGINFSQRNLATPIQITAGQQVRVTVTFSFS